MANESDALVIARWCWPAPDWKWHEADDIAPAGCVCCGNEFWPIEPRHVHDAESVLIERGLAAEYGHALQMQEGIDIGYCRDAPTAEFDTEVTKVAHAPLEVRVKAMAATIRSLKP